ncbi:MAG: 30S ribosomal protein S6 [Patescibacteria group bacterium]
MQIYEVGYLILPSIAENELAGVVDKIKEIIAREGGVEVDGEAPFKQHLAYTMSKTVGASRYVVSDAYFGWLKFELDSSKTTVIKSRLEKLNELLRFLLIKAPRETTFTFAKAKARMAEKGEEQAPAPEEMVVN